MTSRTPSLDRDADQLSSLREALSRAPAEAGDEPRGAGNEGSDGCAWEGCAWAIDPDRAVVLAATAAGAARLCMRGPETATPLDAAMPALRRLRALSSRLGEGEIARETLLFWTKAGSERIAVVIRRAADAAGVFVLHAVPSRSRALGAALDDQEEIEPPPVVRDDAATLREIARRILEGQRKTNSPTEDAERRAPQLAMHDAMTMTAATTPATPSHVDIAKLAHELKTPLSAIVAASEIMRDERFGSMGNERYRGYASDIHDSAQHALAVINSMLGQGRSEAPVTDLLSGAATGPQHFAQVDLSALVEATVSAMRPLSDKAGVRLSAEFASRLPHVIADPVSVRQILLNLLTNAIKFTGAGGTVTVETRYDLDGPVALAVRDTGAGMTAGEIANALSPTRAETTAPDPRPGGGLGIGLPLVRQLAEANGATVHIDSTTDADAARGTTVVVAFAKARVVPV